MLSVFLLLAAVTAGWENISPDRREFPVTKVLWRADFSRTNDFTVSLRDGATGCVDIGADGIRIRKTNADGFIVVTAKPFPAKRKDHIRFSADQVSADSDVNYSNGFLRYYGRTEHFGISNAEGQNFWGGGTHTMRAIPCTSPGMKYRKYAQYYAEDDVVTPVIVVSGTPSDSTWSDWLAEDVDAAQKAWQPFWDSKISGDHSGDRMDEAAFDALIAADRGHVAEIRRIDGVSRLVVDGEVSAPAVYKSKHVYDGSSRDGGDTFAGRPLDGSAVKLMVKEIALGRVPGGRGYWTPDGFDAKGAVKELKDAMRMAPKSLFLVALGCRAYPEFTTKEHPEEAWLRKDGSQVLGNGGSCIVGYSSLGKGVKAQKPWPWVSPASRVFRDAVRGCIREFVAELKRQGLDKRVVGTHLWGYHDGQYSIPYADHSAAAKAEYARIVAEPGCISTNYAFACKQMGFRALEEFAREFKSALGKPAIAAMWCESPLSGGRNASLDITSFVRSDAMDVLVAQPHYRERLPGYPTVETLPCSSFHLHGKMFWNEFDLRTYAALESWANSWVSLKSLGHSEDFPMWQTVYRKLAGAMDAARMGYWFYDMGGGWYETPEIAEDIRALTAESERMVRMKPSTWRPDVAIVVDEANAIRNSDEIVGSDADSYVYAGQFRYFGTSGVPYETFLAEDVLSEPGLLDGRRMVVLAFFRDIDGRRAKLLERLSARGVTQVFLSGTAEVSGGEAIRFKPVVTTGKFLSRVVPEPGVTVNVSGERYTEDMRNWGKEHPVGTRCTVEASDGVKVLARYASDGAPAIAERKDADCRRVYVCEPGGLTPELMNVLARESGAFAATDRSGLQIEMNGDFLSVHCLRPGRYDLRLPRACRVRNLKSGLEEPQVGGALSVELTAGETCRFGLD